MGTTSLPLVTAQLLAAAGIIQTDPYRALIVGQIGDDGTATSGATYEDVESMTNDEIATLFGTNSELTGRIIKARDICGQNFAIWVIALDEVPSTPVAATAVLAFTGTATESRTMTVRPISQNLYSFNIDVTITDTANTVAVAVKAALDALDSKFPASAAIATDTVTLTASDVGTIPNKYAVEIINIPSGIAINTNSKTERVQFSSGATDPSTTTIFDNVGSRRFHSISWPWESDFSDVQDFLEARNVIDNEFLQGVAFIGYDDTEANIATKVNGTTPLNSPNLFFMGNRVVSSAAAIIEPPDWRTAEFIAIEGLRLTDDVPIGQYITTSAPLDTLGGSALASLAYYNTPLAKTSPSDPDLLFDGQEQSNLKADGYSIVGVNTSASSTIMGEVVSTYKFNTLGQDDNSFKYLNYIRTGYLALEYFFQTLKVDYSQSRLTEGDVVAGRAMANQEAIEAEYTRIYKTLSGADFVLTQAGSDAEKFFFRNLTITLDVQDGKVTSIGQLPIVTQIREFNMTFQLAFSIGG